jgi:hypothetical protein
MFKESISLLSGLALNWYLMVPSRIRTTRLQHQAHTFTSQPPSLDNQLQVHSCWLAAGKL